MKHPVHFSNQ